LGLALVMFIGGGFLLGERRHEPAEIASPLVGRPAPAFSLPALAAASGAPAASAARVSPADLRGTPWLLNVFASWCAGCREEHALLVHAARERGATIVGLDYLDRPEVARAWLEGAGDPYAAIALDEDGRAGAAYGVSGVPETFVIDREGVVRLKLLGALTRRALDERVLPLLETLR
jgi:cytochrome c biogenesis protein CcmG/thiol:disulfide interchange protein DsbE